MYQGQFHKLQLISVLQVQGDGYFSGCIHYSTQLVHIQIKQTPLLLKKHIPHIIVTAFFFFFPLSYKPTFGWRDRRGQKCSYKENFPSCRVKGIFNLCSHSLMFCLAHYLLFSYTLKLAVA